MDTVQAAVIKARSAMLMDAPFFGTLALKLKLKEDDAVKTAATDGRCFFYGAKFITQQTQQQLRGLFAHEVMHCVLNHHTRRGSRKQEAWNVACDYAINPLLIKAGFILPDGALNDPQYHDMSAEQIYNLIVDDYPEPQIWGAVFDAESGEGTDSAAAIEADWQIAVTQAAQVAKERGKLPGCIEDMIQDIVKPLVDWRTVLWPFFSSMVNTDYSWRKPHRAYISEDEYLPSMFTEACGPIAICNDTSGSTSDYQEQFFGELNAVVSDLQPEKVVVVQTDYEVQKAFELDHGDRLEPCHQEVKGYGGTAFTPTFEYLHEHHSDIEAIVYLTDLETSEKDFQEAMRYSTCPVLWVTPNKLTAPFGTTVQITI